jgi:putative glutamine amidotransferase
MQIMGIVDNDDFSCLIDVKDKLMHKKDYQGNCYHDITINEKSKLFEIIKESELEVNSIHSKVLSHVTTAKITAFSKEKEIEAIEFDSKKFAVGVQWHPELMIDTINEKLLKQLIENSKQ